MVSSSPLPLAVMMSARRLSGTPSPAVGRGLNTAGARRSSRGSRIGRRRVRPRECEGDRTLARGRLDQALAIGRTSQGMIGSFRWLPPEGARIQEAAIEPNVTMRVDEVEE